eukprot:4131144-Pyramimonas_sp.AAC.1
MTLRGQNASENMCQIKANTSSLFCVRVVFVLFDVPSGPSGVVFFCVLCCAMWEGSAAVDRPGGFDCRPDADRPRQAPSKEGV